ncbi:MSCRAMM family protein [Laedolimicola intestinihominis]|uniref:SpaA isopeptide-forming pilin-related protein n=1 Tax=Laedolimicola intestinihominis TaxID=3133166 RepID=A0ABV1FCZ1_9FIRM
MDFKRIITLFLAIVMCVNLLASAFPTVAYASGGAIQVEASDMSEAKASDDVVMEISGEAKDTGQALEEEKTAEGIGENASVADEEQKTEDDSEKETETEIAAPVEETEKETLIDSGSGDIVVSEDTVKQEEATELQETEEEKVVRLKEMVEAFPEEAELWWMDEDELTVLYDTFSEICDMYESLDAELQEQVDMRKLEAAGAFFASYVDPVSLTNTGDIYSIPSEYGAGIIYQGRKSTAVYGPGWKDGRYATNHSKDKNVWIKYPESGSCYVNGEHVKADVLVYYWLTEGEAFVATSFGHDLVSIGSPAWCGYEPQDFTVELEYHFLRAGTDEELTVDGYLFAHDLDRGEGICGKTGARGYYTSDNTTMRWKGQYVTGTVDDDRTDYSMSVGVAFHAEPSAPFRVSYHGCEYYSIELSSVGVDGKLLKGYGDLNVVKSITNPSSYAVSLAGFTMTLTGTSAYGDAINLTAVTNASGVASFTRVPMGTYTVTENGTASYWDVPASGTVNVEPNQTSLYSVNNIYKTGNVELTKKIETAPEDAYNAAAEAEYHYNDKLVGFAYRISGTSDSGIPVLKYGVTDTQGKLIFKNLPVGTYEVQEVKASAVPADADCKEQATQELYQYVIPDSQKVAVTYNDTAHKGNTSKVTFENKLKKWSFSGKVEPGNSLVKEDEEALSAGISQGDATLAGAVYGLYDGDKLVAQATTNVEGKFDFDGTFVVGDLWYVQEIKASEGYLLDSTKYPVRACALELDKQANGIYKAELKATTAGKNTVTEQVKKQALSFYKISGTDKQSSFEAVEGAGFSVYLVSELADGKYAELSDTELPQAIIDDFRDPTTLDYKAMRQQKPATVYADADSEDVVSGWLSKSVTYVDGMTYQAEGDHAYLVAELISDSRGVVTTPGLPYGRYVIVETTTPKDKIATRPFVVNIVGDDEDGEIRGDGQGQPLDDLVIAVDKPIMSLIRIKKQDANSNKTVLKPGAGYIIHDTNGAWFQYCSAEWTSEQKRAYKNKYGDLVVQSGQGEMVGTKDNPYTTRKITQAEATGNVYVDTPAALPAGTYTLEEVAAPEGYVLQGHEGVIAKDTSIIEGNHTFYETEESGMWGKVDGSVVKIVVSSQEASYDSNVDAFVVTAIQKNEPAIGKISIFAEGEKLVDAKQDGSTILDRLGEAVSSFFGYARGLIGLDVPDEDGLTEKELSEYKDYSFSYELQPIEGAQFEIRAAEDIYSPEGGANVVKLFSEGELVTTLTTNAGGQTWTGQEDWEGTKIAKGLPLGKYTVTQIKAGTGFALTADDVEPREVEIAYAGQEVPVIYRDSSYENPRQKVHVEIQKLDAEQNEPLAGAVFGLYAEEDIANYTGKTVIKAGTLIATGETTVGADGQVQKAVFTPDLPLGKYYIKELQAPMGYTTTQSKISLDASYKEDQREVIEFSENVKNDPVLLQVNVMDYYTEEELDGATLQLIDEDGNSFTTILSAHGDNEIIRGLEIGKTYTLQELVSPQGYHYNLYLKDDYVTKKPNAVELDKSYLDGQVSDKITFTIKDENKLQVVSVFNKPITGNVVVKKTGQVPIGTEKETDENGNVVNKPIYEIKGLPGAEYALLAKEDIVYPDGYTGILFHKGTEVLEQYESLKDTVLKHYKVEVPRGELADVVQRSLPDGSAVKYVLRTGADGKVQVTGLPLGEYEVVEVKAPAGYYRDQNNCTQSVYLVEPEQSGWSEAIVATEAIFQNEKQKAKVTVTKSDRDTGEKLQGAVIGLYTAEVLKNQAGEVIAEADTLLESVITDTEGKAIFECDLPFGRYYVKELTAPEGYYLSAETQYFTFAYAEDSTEMVEFTLQIQNEKKPEPAGQGGSGDSSNVVPLETPLTSDGNALELALLAITVVALIGIIVTVILKMKHVTPGGDEVKNTKV